MSGLRARRGLTKDDGASREISMVSTGKHLLGGDPSSSVVRENHWSLPASHPQQMRRRVVGFSLDGSEPNNLPRYIDSSQYQESIQSPLMNRHPAPTHTDLLYSVESSVGNPPAVSQGCLLLPVIIAFWWYWTRQTASRVWRKYRLRILSPETRSSANQYGVSMALAPSVDYEDNGMSSQAAYHREDGVTQPPLPESDQDGDVFHSWKEVVEHQEEPHNRSGLFVRWIYGRSDTRKPSGRSKRAAFRRRGAPSTEPLRQATPRSVVRYPTHLMSSGGVELVVSPTGSGPVDEEFSCASVSTSGWQPVPDISQRILTLQRGDDIAELSDKCSDNVDAARGGASVYDGVRT